MITKIYTNVINNEISRSDSARYANITDEELASELNRCVLEAPDATISALLAMPECVDSTVSYLSTNKSTASREFQMSITSTLSVEQLKETIGFKLNTQHMNRLISVRELAEYIGSNDDRHSYQILVASTMSVEQLMEVIKSKLNNTERDADGETSETVSVAGDSDYNEDSDNHMSQE